MLEADDLDLLTGKLDAGVTAFQDSMVFYPHIPAARFHDFSKVCVFQAGEANPHISKLASEVDFNTIELKNLKVIRLDVLTSASEMFNDDTVASWLEDFAYLPDQFVRQQDSPDTSDIGVDLCTLFTDNKAYFMKQLTMKMHIAAPGFTICAVPDMLMSKAWVKTFKCDR
jgi:hypothetical protein